MDGSGPPRANAAQMAARKIKAAPRTKRSTSARPENSIPQWAPQPSQSGGGLFGGAVQAPTGGGFTFSPSGPTAPSFPPPSFGGSNGSFGSNSNNIFGGMNNGQSQGGSDQESDRPVSDRPTKKQFGMSTPSAPSASQPNSPFQMPSSFGQGPSNSALTFGTQPSPGTGFIFGTTAPPPSQPPTSPFTFGTSTPQPAQTPAINFGSSLTANKPQTPAINFGSGVGNDKPASNVFNFTPQPAQSPAPTPSLFGQAQSKPEPKPASTPFSFGETSKTPSSGINLGATPAAESPTSNLFGGSKTPSSGINFGATPAADSPTKELFGGSKTPAAAPTTNLFGSVNSNPQTSNIFGNPPSSDSPAKSFFPSQPQSTTNGTNNLFSKTQESVKSSSNLFGNSGQAQTASPMFGEQKSQPSSSIFEGLNKPAQPSSNIFGSPMPQAEQPDSIFANLKPATSTNNLFGASSKPVEQPPTPFSLNSAENSRQASPENASSPTKDLFSNLNKPLNQPTTEPKANSAPSALNRAPLQSAHPTNGVFGAPDTSVDQPAVQPESSASSQVTNHQSTTATAPQQGSPAQGNSWAKVNWSKANGVAVASQPPNLRIFSQDIPPFKEPQSNQPYSSEVVSLMDSISNQEIEENFKVYELFAPKIPQKAPSMTLEEGNLVRDTRGDFKEYPKLFPGLNFAKTFPLEKMASLVPENYSPEQRIEFYVAYRMKILNNELRKYFETVSVTTNIIPAIMFYQVQRTYILRRGTVEYTNELRRLGIQPQSTEPDRKGSFKRAANDEDQENVPPTKRTKPFALPSEAPQSNGPATLSSLKPPKPSYNAAAPQPYYTNGTAAATPPTQLPQPSISQSSISASPAKGKRKGEELTKDSPQKRNSPLKQAGLQNGTSTASGSATSNAFKSILNSPAKSTPEKKPTGSLAKPAEDTPRANPFQNLFVPKSPTKASSPSTANMFAPKPSSPAKPPAASPFAPATTPGNLFSAKSSATTSTAIPSTPFAFGSSATPDTSQKTPAIQMPKFGNLTSSAADFAAKLAKDKEEHEQALLKKAIDADYDSEEDNLDEFKADFWKKRAADLKEIEEAAKKPSGFMPKFPQPAAPLSGLFGTMGTQNSTAFGLVPENSSRASTPGPITSAAGSVFDGHESGKAGNYGGIFSHLSAANSPKDNDADDQSADEDADGESDSENKDPNYKPGDESNGPGTPASETGAGIASAKKPVNVPDELDIQASPLSLGKYKVEAPVSPSPSNSLEDRMSKDSNGNLIRQIPPEEKENTEPAPTNIFGGLKSTFGQSPAPAADKTWKPDSPIKFGSTTPNGDAKSDAPTVSVTAATPTKPFSSLFGSNKDTKATPPMTFGSNSAAPSLFANLNTPKPAVGFNFGASSTPSSLFPSAAVSADTSRATTPGGTTDGDSGVEADPDAEHHDQIDLTSGGPGEEDEEALHEVRAKAMKFITKGGESAWASQGVGPLRVLRNKETKATRIVVRVDPTGKIVFNNGLLPNCKYEANGKTVKITAVTGEGKEGIQTWVMQIKTPEAANALAAILEENKNSA